MIVDKDLDDLASALVATILGIPMDMDLTIDPEVEEDIALPEVVRQ